MELSTPERSVALPCIMHWQLTFILTGHTSTKPQHKSIEGDPRHCFLRTFARLLERESVDNTLQDCDVARGKDVMHVFDDSPTFNTSYGSLQVYILPPTPSGSSASRRGHLVAMVVGHQAVNCPKTGTPTCPATAPTTKPAPEVNSPEEAAAEDAVAAPSAIAAARWAMSRVRALMLRPAAAAAAEAMAGLAMA
ncbi:hypothetical protein C8F01DRAFT_1378662 [Mycena amicta]|nr:hypothetical protein C8F01DRAFT_1378662 [Mycena amicta]